MSLLLEELGVTGFSGNEIQTYEEPDRINGVNYWVKRLIFKVPMPKGTPDEFDTIEFKRDS